MIFSKKYAGQIWGSPHSVVRTAAHAYDRPAPGTEETQPAATPPRFRCILPAKAGNSPSHSLRFLISTRNLRCYRQAKPIRTKGCVRR